MKTPSEKPVAFPEIFKRPVSRRTRIVQLISRFLRADCNVEPLPDPNGDMVTIEQRLNIHHLLSSLLLMEVPGDVVELGCFEGQTAVQIGKLLHGIPRHKLHLYDSFKYKYKGSSDVERALKENFEKYGVPVPEIHKGEFFETVPGQLPEKICFAHIDTGAGQPVEEHKKLIKHLLESIYPRLSRNAVCLLMDYHDERYQHGSTNPNPGVRAAADEFLADKEEAITILYGGHYSHAYFRKL